ncbi:hypothetical protein H2201_001834 [Coniosporium apollinis]|uniref:CN hydrolase domain-containing protein n=2 Tax=Coniosporium TaxID=2810619 RepID=A0ABQ9P1W5_9PEZI|nr:hypothetical protein H2201_001834 [Coniosporium apollinis]
MAAGRLRVAVCHSSPVWLSSRQTTEKAVSLIHQAAKVNANLVVFPETFIPAFPIWSALLPPTDNHAMFQRMAAESVTVDSQEVHAVRDAAKENDLLVSLGISEKVDYSSGTLFNSNLLIGIDGRILIHHRKLMPTFFEKLTWSPGDGHGLRVANTPFGRIGALICGENTNPLARYALMAQGEQVHISTWPALWPTRVDKSLKSTNQPETEGGQSSLPTTGAGANYDNIAANRVRAAAHCFEAKCFGVLCAGHLNQKAMTAFAGMSNDPDYVYRVLERSPRAASMVLDPTGAPMKGFTVDAESGAMEETQYLQNEEGILYADLDLGDCVEGKQYHDVVGGYQRFDVFDLKVDRSRRTPATFTENFKKARK